MQDPKKNVFSVLDRYLAYSCAQDIPWLLKLFYLESPFFCFLGPGLNEKATSPEDLQRVFLSYFQQGKTTHAKGEYPICRIEGSCAWVMGEFILRTLIPEGGEIILNPRISAVLQKVDQSWLIEHLHCSIPWMHPV